MEGLGLGFVCNSKFPKHVTTKWTLSLNSNITRAISNTSPSRRDCQLVREAQYKHSMG